MYNLIFDIDGTLLPLSQEAFTKEFVRLVSERLCPDPDCGPRIPEYIMRCAEAVVRNDIQNSSLGVGPGGNAQVKNPIQE